MGDPVAAGAGVRESASSRRVRKALRACRLAASVLLLSGAGACAGGSPGSPEGFGAGTPGGTGQPVHRVTNRNDSGPGSLRDAVSGGNRTVVFDVAGTIRAVDRYVDVRGAFVTIDGTTAPPPGITLSGWGLRTDGRKGAHDVIIRGLRIRDVGQNGVGDGISVTEGAYNVLVDHVSIGDTADGSIDVTRRAHDVTIQWSMLQRKPRHNLLSITSYGATRVSYHHNLFIGGESRSPQASWNVSGAPPEVVADIRNNLIWDFGELGTTVVHGATANVVANYYHSSTPHTPGQALQVKTSEGSRVWADGNLSQNGADVDGQSTETAPFPALPLETTDACAAAHEVVRGAGARPLDAHDRAFVSSVRPSCAGAPSDSSRMEREP